MTTNYWHVRISPSKKTVVRDYIKFVETIVTTGEGLWDKDHKNQIKIGDYLGFITGIKNNEQIHIYRVINIRSTEERPTYWASNTPYTNKINPVSHRDVIVLTNNHLLPQSYSWRVFRHETGLGRDCESWMPRGTEKVMNKETLPFNIDDLPNHIIPIV